MEFHCRRSHLECVAVVHISGDRCRARALGIRRHSHSHLGCVVCDGPDPLLPSIYHHSHQSSRLCTRKMLSLRLWTGDPPLPRLQTEEPSPPQAQELPPPPCLKTREPPPCLRIASHCMPGSGAPPLALRIATTCTPWGNSRVGYRN
jgi:hypothetical protein